MKKNYMIIFLVVIMLCVCLIKINNSKVLNNAKTDDNIPNLGDIGGGILFSGNLISFESNKLGSRNVQNAIDELYASIDEGCKAGYSKGTTNGGTYACNQNSTGTIESLNFESENVNYDNTNSGLTADDVSEAIIELADMIPNCKTGYVQENITSSSYDCKEVCNPPTNVNISSSGVVTWAASNNASSYEISIDGTNYTSFANGSNYGSTITSTAGSRTVYVRSVCGNTYDNSNRTTSKAVTVHSVSLTKGTGISAVTGAGNYISGGTVTLGATISNGYTWSKWTQTSGGADVSSTKAYSSAISSNWAYTANATPNTYTLTYDDNLFAATSQTQNGITATYTENGSYLTLNGTATNQTVISQLWDFERRTINAGDQYKITIKYISGSMTRTDTTKNMSLVLDLTTDGSVFGNRTDSPLSYKTVALPEAVQDATTTGTLTVDSSRATANGLQYWLWESTLGNATFTDYKVQIQITQVHSKTITFDSTYGTLPTPTKTGYDFDGWYTAMTGGTQVTSSSTCSTTGDRTIYARWTSHKLYVQYNGNGSDVTWCSTNTYYDMDSDKYEIVKSSSSRNIHTIAYGQYISYSDGLNNYNNSSYTCFAKSGYTAKVGKHWILNGKTATYDHDNTSYTTIGVANDNSCNLATSSTCTVRLNVNWKNANPIAVTASQTWSPTFSTSAQDHTFTAATSGQGSVTYAINTQPSGNYFSIPTASTASIRMAASTPAGSYTVKIRATAAGNNDYISGYKDITLTVTVGRSKTATTGSCLTPTFSGSAQNLAGNGSHVTYSGNSQTYVGSSAYTVTVNAAANYAFSDGTTSKTLSCNIAARATTCTSGSSSRAYNGSALTNSTGSCTNLPTGYTATFSNSGTITNVGSTSNTISSVTIKDSGGTNRSGNFTITKSAGTLTVTTNTSMTLSLSKTSGTNKCLSDNYTSITATVNNGAANITCSSSDTTIVKCTVEGIFSGGSETTADITIKGVKSGSATITVTATAPGYQTKTATYSSTVKCYKYRTQFSTNSGCRNNCPTTYCGGKGYSCYSSSTNQPTGSGCTKDTCVYCWCKQ